MKRNVINGLMVAFAALTLLAGHALAAPDNYEGDTAIYTLGGNAIPANVVFLIDNSQTGKNITSGEPYDSTTLIPGYPDYGYERTAVYKMDNQGEFSIKVLTSYTQLEGCDQMKDDDGVAIWEDPDATPPVPYNLDTYIRDTLKDTGTYSAAGTPNSPGIKAAKNTCSDKESGTYALGNYLNYLKTPAPNPPSVYVLDSSNNKIWYTLNESHRAASAAFSPAYDPAPTVLTIYKGVLADVPPEKTASDPLWTLVTSMPDHISQEITAYSNSLSSLTQTEIDAKVEKLLAFKYKWKRRRFYTREGQPQIEIIFQSIANVVGGYRSGSIRFGAMEYAANNAGGEVLAPVAKLTTDDAYEDFLAKLPQKPMSTAKGGDLLTSPTARPGAGAVRDALSYYMGEDTLTWAQKANPYAGQSPIEFYCQPNYLIYIANGATEESWNASDGKWFQDMTIPTYDEAGNVTGTVGAPCGNVDGDNHEVNSGSCDSAPWDGGTHYLDDLAYYMRHGDLYSDSILDANGDSKWPGQQVIHTATILAFAENNALMESTGINGGLGFYTAKDAYELQADLTAILGNIVRKANASFIAPVVPASPENRVRSGRRIYLGFFKPNSGRMWDGNLKKYSINADGEIEAEGPDGTMVPWNEAGKASSYWDTTVDANDVNLGGVGARLKAQVENNTRKVYTFFGETPDLNDAKNSFSLDNKVKIAGSVGISEAEAEELILFVNGKELPGDGSSPVPRSWPLGDILHSKPNVFNYNSYEFTDANEKNGPPGDDWAAACVAETAKDETACNKSVIFVGSNDGMLHAFSDYDGEELWGFIPPNLRDNLHLLPGKEHHYFVDGSPIIYSRDQNEDGDYLAADNDYVILVFGTRRGGGQDNLDPNLARGTYYALDVTTPNDPKFLFSIDSTGITRAEGGVIKSYTRADGEQYDFSELGETWSAPFIRRVMEGGIERVAMFIGAGYDNNEDQRWGSTQEFPLSTDPTKKTDMTSLVMDQQSLAFELPTSNTVLVDADSNETVSPYFADGCRTDGLCGQVEPRGRGVYVVEIAQMESKLSDPSQLRKFTNTGEKIWGYTHSTPHTSATGHVVDDTMDYSFPADVRVVDVDGDEQAEMIYAADTGGRLWRFDVSGYGKDSWTGEMIFDANTSASDGSEGRKFFYIPEYDLISHNQVNLFLGSGDRAHPLNYLDLDDDPTIDDGTLDRLYMVKDYFQDTSGNTGSIYEAGGGKTLVDLTDDPLQDDTLAALHDKFRFELEHAPWESDGNGNSGKYGWFMKLKSRPGEKALSPPQEVLGLLLQTTYAPNLTVDDPCKAGNQGYARFYALKADTGEAFLDLDKDGDVDADDRGVDVGGGIPPGVTLIVTAEGVKAIIISEDDSLDGDDTAQTIVTGINVGEIETVVPVYWMQW